MPLAVQTVFVLICSKSTVGKFNVQLRLASALHHAISLRIQAACYLFFLYSSVSR